mmetsp:Transcript_91452/g.258986  ORF Transcript_91452/g.258986 Transcript_91452/m.258986 type:complete len:220 (-) Transcript_91452:472-1131(-)
MCPAAGSCRGSSRPAPRRRPGARRAPASWLLYRLATSASRRPSMAPAAHRCWTASMRRAQLQAPPPRPGRSRRATLRRPAAARTVPAAPQTPTPPQTGRPPARPRAPRGAGSAGARPPSVGMSISDPLGASKHGPGSQSSRTRAWSGTRPPASARPGPACCGAWGPPTGSTRRWASRALTRGTAPSGCTGTGSRCSSPRGCTSPSAWRSASPVTSSRSA